MSENPYLSLDETAFWAPAVARRDMFEIEGLWKAPFSITARTKIATFGSCFAQHFSRALLARNFAWLNAEPAPALMSPELAKKLNYGVFSARTGNIYTASLLRQWTEWALGVKPSPPICWEMEGRFHDPFRPAIEPGGFGSEQEMLALRAGSIAAFRKALLTCDLFVFTLGLTESWWDAEGGFEYPMCPGTVAGTFDPQRHVFVNQDYAAIRQALGETIRMIRKARGTGPRVLLTVSPVPLTATNSGEHVLVATMGSKSILRAVAGDIARRIPAVSYFPSYEIIVSHPFRARFFEQNLRGVRQEGVEHVMANFFAGLGDGTLANPSAMPAPERTEAVPETDPDDDPVCEEELLKAFGPAR